jgi:hypothetical protein
VLSWLGHRDVGMGAIMYVLDDAQSGAQVPQRATSNADHD